MSKMCCTRLAENTGRKNSPPGHHRTTLSRYIFAIKTVSTIGKNLLNSSISPTCPYNMVNFGPLVGEIIFVGLGHPSKFQRLSCLGSVTARYSSSERQPNFSVLNRGRHLYSAGQPLCLASAHILVHFKK